MLCEIPGEQSYLVVVVGWGACGVGERVWVISPHTFSVKLALDAGLEEQLGVECMELWVECFLGGGDSVGKGMELGKCEAWLGTAGHSISSEVGRVE